MLLGFQFSRRRIRDRVCGRLVLPRVSEVTTRPDGHEER